MMMSLNRSLYALIALSLSLSGAQVFAVSDVIGTAGDFTRETGSRGAVVNRELANQLYKQALADEKAAWSTFPPNVALLSKALQQSKDGKAADDQAKEFARAAQHGINSGGNSGDFKLKEYGIISDKELKDLATGSSPYRGAVEGKLGGYGMKLSEDKMSIKTPIGTLPLNMDTRKLEGGLRKIAESLGYKGDDVSKGMRAAEAARDAMASQIVAAVDKRLGASPGGGAGFGDGTMPKESDLAAEQKPEAGAAVAAAVPEGGAFVQDDASRQAELMKNRELFLQKLGANPESLGPIHGPGDDLFRIVHMKYQSLRGEGVFNESEIVQLISATVKPTPTGGPQSKILARVPTAVPNGPIRPMSQNNTK